MFIDPPLQIRAMGTNLCILNLHTHTYIYIYLYIIYIGHHNLRKLFEIVQPNLDCNYTFPGDLHQTEFRLLL